MASSGNTGMCGLKPQKVEQLNAKKFKPRVCDMCHDNPGREWFGLTSVITCGSIECVAEAQRGFDEMCKQFDEENDW